MKYEIEFLPVGNGEKSGDAILIRWEESQDNYKVMVVDGGTKESGKKNCGAYKNLLWNYSCGLCSQHSS